MRDFVWLYLHVRNILGDECLLRFSSAIKVVKLYNLTNWYYSYQLSFLERISQLLQKNCTYPSVCKHCFPINSIQY